MFNVLHFGAKGDGVTLDTAAVQAALDAAAAAGGGTVVFPGGFVYKCGTLVIGSDTELHLETGAVVKGSEKLDDYRFYAQQVRHERTVPSYEECGYDGSPAQLFLYAAHAKNIRITGHGTIDGTEEIYYGREEPELIDGAWYPRTPLLYLEDVEGLTVQDVTLTRSGFWTLHMVGCRDVLVEGVRIRNNMRMANCDGIDPDHCRNVRIANCFIETADDGIVLKNSGAHRAYGPTENVVITGCTFRSASGAIKIGTETEGDFRNILVDGCVMFGTNRGISIQLRDDGNIEQVQISNLLMDTQSGGPQFWGRGEAVAITALERAAGRPTGTIRRVRISNVTGSCESGILICGNEAAPIEDLTLSQIDLVLRKVSPWPLEGYDLRPCAGEDILLTPIYGVFAGHTKGLRLEDVRIRADASMEPWFGGERCIAEAGV